MPLPTEHVDHVFVLKICIEQQPVKLLVFVQRLLTKIAVIHIQVSIESNRIVFQIIEK